MATEAISAGVIFCSVVFSELVVLLAVPFEMVSLVFAAFSFVSLVAVATNVLFSEAAALLVDIDELLSAAEFPEFAELIGELAIADALTT
jgi:hypothetical protein